MVFGCTCWTIGFIYPNEHRFHPVATNLVRGFSVAIVCSLYARWKGTDLTFPDPHNFKYQIIRNTIMAIQGLAYAGVQFYLPLPIAITLTCASPIFTSFFDRVLNKVYLNRTQTLWLVVAFLGVVLTANGKYFTYLISGNQTEGSTSFQNYLTTDPTVTMAAALIFTCVMVLHGYGVVVTKRLVQTQSIHVNYFQGVLILLVNALLVPYA
jgi:drug/metabolite transporter (DMT)-like permease